MMPTETQLFEAVDATWPAARFVRAGRWTLRDGQGGGNRVSSATAMGPVTVGDIEAAENAMIDKGQEPLFMIRGIDAALDAKLAARGYQVIDPVVLLTAPVKSLAEVPIPPLTTFTIWEPLAIMDEIWAKGGVGPARRAVMARAGTKTAVFARWKDKPAGVAFVALSGKIAMVHAVEVLEHQRRQGVAQWIMRQAAVWAARQGATTLAVLCTKENAPALGLYSALGFAPSGQYHYRVKPDSGDLAHG